MSETPATDLSQSTPTSSDLTTTSVNINTNSLPDEYAFLGTWEAQLSAGIFAFSAMALCLYQIYLHLVNYVVVNEQRWIVRILFICPVYAFCSWLSLVFWKNNEAYVYFNAIRDCYEAFVIYCFLSLCFEYLGGEGTILNEIQGKPVRGANWFYCGCWFENSEYDISFLRFWKQSTLQFVAVKPIMAILTIVFQAKDFYHEGDYSLTSGYIYVLVIYNISICFALYALAFFYLAVQDMLAPFSPKLKFVSVKLIIFLSYWQGMVITALEHNGTIKHGENLTSGTVAAAWQNFLICIEMFLAAILLWFAFPYKIYAEKAQTPDGRSAGGNKNSLSHINANFRDTINPRDFVQDAITNFTPTYQSYAHLRD